MSNFAFGTYRISDLNPQHIEALREAIASGICMIDTSSNYMDGGAERAIAAAFRGLDPYKKDEIEIVSKYGYLQGTNLLNYKNKLLKIKNEQDLSNFVAELNADQLVNIVGKGRMYLYPLTTGAKIPAQMRGSILLRSLSEFLRVHAITGNVNPMDLATLKSTIDKLSTVPTMKGLFVYSPAFLEMLLTPTSYIAGDAKNITTYYQNLLRQRLS